MATEDDLDQLRRKLSWEGAGPLTDLSNQVAAAVFARLHSVAQWVREKAEDQPLVSLLLAFQLGFVVGYRGTRHAKH